MPLVSNWYRVDFLDRSNLPIRLRKGKLMRRDLVVEVRASSEESAREIALEQARLILENPRIGDLKAIRKV